MSNHLDLEEQLQAFMSARRAVTSDEVFRSEPAQKSPEKTGGESVVRYLPIPTNHRRQPSLRVALGWVAALVILAFVIVVAVVVPLPNGSSNVGPLTGASIPAPLVGSEGSIVRQVVDEITSVPSTFSEATISSRVSNYPEVMFPARSRLTENGLPELAYAWGSYSPFSAVENWALVMALSKFGTFKGLTIDYSSATDYAPDTATLSFYKATYSSRFLVFKAYDLASSEPAARDGCDFAGYRCVQKVPTKLEFQDRPSSGAIPTIDFANEYEQVGAGSPSEPLDLAGLSLQQVAFDVRHDPSSPVAIDLTTSANYFTAAICAMTGDQPRSICKPNVIAEAQGREASRSFADQS